MTDRLRQLLSSLKDGLAEIYGRRLAGVYLFGSHARGEAGQESDCDVLVVLDSVADYGAEIDRTSELVSRVSLDYRVSVSRVFASAADWAHGGTSFLRNVREEAVPA